MTVKVNWKSIQLMQAPIDSKYQKHIQSDNLDEIL